MVGRFAKGTMFSGVLLELLLLLDTVIRGGKNADSLVCGVPLFTVVMTGIGCLLLYCAFVLMGRIWAPLVPRPLWWGTLAGLAYLPGYCGWCLGVDFLGRLFLVPVRQEWIVYIMPLAVWPLAVSCFLWRRAASPP